MAKIVFILLFFFFRFVKYSYSCTFAFLATCFFFFKSIAFNLLLTIRLFREFFNLRGLIVNIIKLKHNVRVIDFV